MLRISSDHNTSAVAMVETVLNQAVLHNASDIHFEPSMAGLLIRVRVDGLLYDAALLDTARTPPVLARLKVLANINVAEKRIPQDGKFGFTYKARAVDVRVSTFPSCHGEKIVLRLLDQERLRISLQELGFVDDMLTACRSLLSLPHGFFLVAGPTGSGKTTTLYAALSALNERSRHIITLEDPVEYHIAGITQAQIHPEAGFTFEKGIRALLRQDPDIVMVGEMRDKQTAHIAIEAALTGHLVLSTIHAGDAPSVVMRLLDMGIEPFLINAAVSGVLAQRLARRLCDACKVARPLTSQEADYIKNITIPVDQVYEAAGCSHCHGLGYKGRVGIFQLLTMSDALRALIVHNPGIDMIRTQAQKDGMANLITDAVYKLKAGVISFAEMLKVA
ncbi:hypothetical protein Noda2021_07920 [Candidatus Dependentiae bacterium Noda2021]|nr:hypothetical protein Noda2021_07920 [Candidatus Dependentiae bacterium Noda2021]